LDFNNITIGESLGKGTFGQVYTGTYLGTNVAVKELFSNKLTDAIVVEFHQECNVMKDIRHPNIVLFMGSSFDSPKLYMIMELCELGSVMNLYMNIPKISEFDVHMGKVLDLASGIAMGGNYLHCHNPQIIHRDLKSENVLVDSNFVPKITDFGQSKFSEASDAARAMTACGSPLWTAPEVIRGEPYDSSADIFSFSIILYELLSWKNPYIGQPAHAIMMKVAAQGYRMEIEEEWDDFYKELLVECWHAEPSKRPSFRQIVDRISEVDNNPMKYGISRFKGDWRVSESVESKLATVRSVRNNSSTKKLRAVMPSNNPNKAKDGEETRMAEAAASTTSAPKVTNLAIFSAERRRSTLVGGGEAMKSSQATRHRSMRSERKKSSAAAGAAAGGATKRRNKSMAGMGGGSRKMSLIDQAKAASEQVHKLPLQERIALLHQEQGRDSSGTGSVPVSSSRMSSEVGPDSSGRASPLELEDIEEV
jgi:serine/threonine protein kinase